MNTTKRYYLINEDPVLIPLEFDEGKLLLKLARTGWDSGLYRFTDLALSGKKEEGAMSLVKKVVLTISSNEITTMDVETLDSSTKLPFMSAALDEKAPVGTFTWEESMMREIARDYYLIPFTPYEIVNLMGVLMRMPSQLNSGDWAGQIPEKLNRVVTRFDIEYVNNFGDLIKPNYKTEVTNKFLSDAYDVRPHDWILKPKQVKV
jgi:hypothetical protein